MVAIKKLMDIDVRDLYFCVAAAVIVDVLQDHEMLASEIDILRKVLHEPPFSADAFVILTSAVSPPERRLLLWHRLSG